MQYWPKLTCESQCCALNVDIMQCLVMILEIFPETGAVEIICPEKEANLLAERVKSESMILSMVLQSRTE